MISPDWTTIGTIASTVALVMGGFLWAATKLFQLGKTTQRLDSIESDVQDLRHEMRTAHAGLNQRIDKLIFTIAESNKR